MKRRASVKPPSAPASFATVARTVSGWTTNLLATGMILVLALGLGRQLVGWWRIEPDQALPALPTDQFGLGGADPSGPYTLEFGDSPYSIDQRMVRGDRAAAVEQLLVSCRQAAAQSDPPVEPPGEAEKKLLETVQLLEPLEVSGGVRFYGPDAGFPLLVAVAPTEAGRTGELSPNRPARPENRGETLPAEPRTPATGPPAAQLGASRDRVVVWGIAASAGEQVWSLYTFRLGELRAAPLVDVPSVSLPPGSRRTMALRDARGETLLGLAGSDTVGSDSVGSNTAGAEIAGRETADEWRRSFAQGFNRTGWSVAEDWQLAGDIWHARYARGEGSRRWTADVQFGPETSGRLSGLVRIVPAASQAPASRTEQEQR